MIETKEALMANIYGTRYYHSYYYIDNYNDTLVGTSNADNIYGFGGSDTIWGGAGNDVINAGTETTSSEHTIPIGSTKVTGVTIPSMVERAAITSTIAAHTVM
jgi:hypothetical protein